MAEPDDDSLSEGRFVRRVLTVAAIVSLFILAWVLRELAITIFGAIVVGSLLSTAAKHIKRLTSLSDGPSLFAAIFLIFSIVLGSFYLFGAQLSSQIDLLQENVPRARDAASAWLEQLGILPGEAIDFTPDTGSLVKNASVFLSSAANFGLAALLMIVGGIFIAGQPRFYRTGLIKLFPQDERGTVATAITDSMRALRLWLQAQAVAMLAVGLVTGIGLYLLGVPSALALGLLAGLLEFIPYAGPIIAAIPAILMAFTVSPQLALWTAFFYLIVQQIESYVMQPLLQQWAVEVPAFVMLFSIVACGSLFGFIGVVLGAPLTVVLYVLVKRLYIRGALDTHTPMPGEGDREKKLG